MATNMWIKKTVSGSHKGALHRALNVAEDKKIPAKKMAKGDKSRNIKIRKEVAEARTLEKLRKKK